MSAHLTYMCIPGWQLVMLEDWGTMTRLCSYGMLMTCAEWWAFELTILLSGLIGINALAAQTIVFNIDLIVASVSC